MGGGVGGWHVPEKFEFWWCNAVHTSGAGADTHEPRRGWGHVRCTPIPCDRAQTPPDIPRHMASGCRVRGTITRGLAAR